MSIVPITLPVVKTPNGFGGGVTWETTCVPTIETTPDVDGFGCTTAIFGYLSDIWARVVHPVSRTADEPIDIFGSGEYVLPGFDGNPYLAAINLDLVPPPPNNTDLLFGEVPIYYLGMVGFGVVPSFQGNIRMGPLPLSGRVSFGDMRKTPPVFINHLNNFFTPPHPQCNGFWWHLKEGVRGTFVPVAIDYGLGATANPLGSAQTWEPSYGGWCPIPASPFGQVFDGCGLPACKND